MDIPQFRAGQGPPKQSLIERQFYADRIAYLHAAGHRPDAAHGYDTGRYISRYRYPAGNGKLAVHQSSGVPQQPPCAPGQRPPNYHEPPKPQFAGIGGAGACDIGLRGVFVYAMNTIFGHYF